MKKRPTKQQQNVIRNSQTSTSSSTTVIATNKSEVLNKIFGGDIDSSSSSLAHFNKNRVPTPQNLKFNQSLSFDEASLADFHHQPDLLSSSSSSSRRLEEFKRVVESSYEEHVLNKVTTPTDQTKQPDLFMRRPSTAPHTQLTQQTSPQTPILADLDHINSSRQQQQSNNGSSSSRVKIPYMSAYNIYDYEDFLMSSARVNVNLDMTTTSNPMVTTAVTSVTTTTNTPVKKTPKVGSNGSSLNTSPTSMSSGESGIVGNMHRMLHHTHHHHHHEDLEAIPATTGSEMTAKPPLTPKRPQTGAPTFRHKNLLRRSSNSATTTNNAIDNNNHNSAKLPPLDSVIGLDLAKRTSFGKLYN